MPTQNTLRLALCRTKHDRKVLSVQSVSDHTQKDLKTQVVLFLFLALLIHDFQHNAHARLHSERPNISIKDRETERVQICCVRCGIYFSSTEAKRRVSSCIQFICLAWLTESTMVSIFAMSSTITFGTTIWMITLTRTMRVKLIGWKSKVPSSCHLYLCRSVLHMRPSLAGNVHPRVIFSLSPGLVTQAAVAVQARKLRQKSSTMNVRCAQRTTKSSLHCLAVIYLA